MSQANGKGRDLGYALAAGSCEGANCVESCTITAFDVITAFAVPNPGFLLAESAGFFGSGCSSSCLAEQITQLTSDWLSFNLSQPFQPSTGAKLNVMEEIVNATFWCS